MCHLNTVRRLGITALVTGLIVATATTAQAQRVRAFSVEEATIDGIQTALKQKRITTVGLVNAYLARIRAFNGQCVSYQQNDILGTFSPIPNAGQLNALLTINLRPSSRKALGLDDRKARSLTDTSDSESRMPDALEVAAQQDAIFAKTGRLVGPLHGVVLAVKDQYDTFDMRTTSGMDARYANDRPPDDATFVSRLRASGAIILAKANQGEMASAMNRSSFGGVMCNPYDTTRNPGHSSGGSGIAVGANLVTCAIGEDTGGSVMHPARNNAIVAIVPTQELVSRDGMIGAGMTTRVGPMCRNAKDTARLLDVIAGYDSKDEMTAFAVGRLPAKSYQSYADGGKLTGLRIGIIREYMDKKLFTKADEESIDIAERAIGDLRRLGATIVDPGPNGSLMQPCVNKYAPFYMSRQFTSAHPTVFPARDGKPTADHVNMLLDMFADPSKVPAGPSIRDLGGRPPSTGENKFMLERYLRERGDAKIKSIDELIANSTFFSDIRPDTGFSDRRAALQNNDDAMTLDMVAFYADRYAYQQVVLQCMAQEQLDALFAPAGSVPAYILGQPSEPTVNGRGNSVWSLLGTKGFPMIGVPSGFTTQVYDRVRDAAAPGGTRLVGPVQARVPVAVNFFARPFAEDVLFRIAAAYELATKHRVPPPEFGPVRAESTQ